MQLALRTGLHLNTIYNLEAEKTSPRLDALVKIQNVLSKEARRRGRSIQPIRLSTPTVAARAS